MLLPDGIHPEQSIYYNGAFVLKTVQQHRILDFLDLYSKIREIRGISMPVFVLCLDWLFLLNVITLNAQGQVELCS